VKKDERAVECAVVRPNGGVVYSGMLRMGCMCWDVYPFPLWVKEESVIDRCCVVCAMRVVREDMRNASMCFARECVSVCHHVVPCVTSWTLLFLFSVPVLVFVLVCASANIPPACS